VDDGDDHSRAGGAPGRYADSLRRSGCAGCRGPLDAAGSDQLTFATDDRHYAAARTSPAGAILVTKAVEGVSRPQLVVGNVDAALIEAMKIFAPRLAPAQEGIDPTARIAKDVRIGDHVSIGAYVVIDEGVKIGDHAIIAAGCRIGQNVEIGDQTRLDCNVVIYYRCRIGSHVVIQANSTIGSVGFGYALVDGTLHLVPHNGGVIIEDFVEIGPTAALTGPSSRILLWGQAPRWITWCKWATMQS